MKAMKTVVGLVLAASVVVTATASAQGAPRKDFQIAMDILTTVTEYDEYTIFDDLQAHVKDGVATLTGKVTMPYKRTEIEKRVKRIKGITSVRNRIEVLPPSKFDDEVRARVANAIYNNSNFWQYSTLRDPPIHILVEGSQG